MSHFVSWSSDEYSSDDWDSSSDSSRSSSPSRRSRSRSQLPERPPSPRASKEDHLVDSKSNYPQHTAALTWGNAQNIQSTAPPLQYPQRSPDYWLPFDGKTYTQPHLSAISLVEEKKVAYDKCKALVERIARECRSKNRKFRDVEFDLKNDREACLNRLGLRLDLSSDVQRVSNIFPSSPTFYSGTERSYQIRGWADQSSLLSAFSSLTAMRVLVDDLCVARDEEVGVYGFLFYRDCYWVSVVIDDFLCMKIPKYEQLSAAEQDLYHQDKERFNSLSRKNPSALYYAQPLLGGDTWIPLAEKAYAKLHGDYESIGQGLACEVLEDITGGISSTISTSDILDSEQFWQSELLLANKDRIFGCTVQRMTSGLLSTVNYSVVRAIEVNGRRLIVIRNPRGKEGAQWTGPWSDKSREWSLGLGDPQWLQVVLKDLQYEFGGEHGEFVMEYTDFLSTWDEIQRTIVLDESWIMSCLWLRMRFPYPDIKPHTFGVLNYTFNMSHASPAIIVLTTSNTRYFQDIQGPYKFNLNFVLVKLAQTGQKSREKGHEIIAESSYSSFYSRCVSVEMQKLEPGDYAVLARLDPDPSGVNKSFLKENLEKEWDRRKLGRVVTEKIKGQSISANYIPHPSQLPVSAPAYLSSIDFEKLYPSQKYKEGENPGWEWDDIPFSTQPPSEKVVSPAPAAPPPAASTIEISETTSRSTPIDAKNPASSFPKGAVVSMPPPLSPPAPASQVIPPLYPSSPRFAPLLPPAHEFWLMGDNSMVFGLKVHTKEGAKVIIQGRINPDYD